MEGVPQCDGYFPLGWVEVWGGRAPEELINVEGRDWVFGPSRWWQPCWDGSGVSVAFVGGKGVDCGGDDVLGLSLKNDVALCATIVGYVGCSMDADVGQSALVGLFPPVYCLRPLVPWDVFMVVFWWGRSENEGFYPVQGDCVLPGPAGQDVYARVSRHCASDAFPWGAGHGTLRWTRASEQAGKALRSQGHQCAHVM